MQILILSKEDFKEPEYWIALCDKLGISGEYENISLGITVVEPH